MRIILITITLCISQVVFAQNYSKSTTRNVPKDQFILNWEIAIPSNNNYLSKTSFRGGKLEYRKFFKENLAMGISIGWNSFEEFVDKQLYESEDGSNAVFTDVVRQIYTIPISINGYYYFDNPTKLKPYLGLGIGAAYAEQKAYFNIYLAEERSWGFLVRPEIGLQYELKPGFGFSGYVAYNYATNRSDFFPNDNLKHLGIGLGFYLQVK